MKGGTRTAASRPGNRRGLTPSLAAAWILAIGSTAAAQTPITGHYPPGQTGLRGAAAGPEGWSFTNFNRFFSKLEAVDANGNPTGQTEDLRYANVSMFTWVSPWKILGMSYGALAGIPFSTGNLQPSSEELHDSSLGLGDVLITPVSLTGTAALYDYQFQFTAWSDSGRFHAGAPDNRGKGFWTLVYSAGAVWYPGGSRDDWSLSAVARFEQNFEQKDTRISPGDDVVVDWGVGKVVRLGSRRLDLGISGFATWQLNEQKGGPPADTSRYRYFGAGPEAALATADWLTLRIRLHWEFGVRNAVRGNNAWLIAHVRL